MYQKVFISIPPSIHVFDTSSGTNRIIASANVNAKIYLKMAYNDNLRYDSYIASLLERMAVVGQHVEVHKEQDHCHHKYDEDEKDVDCH